MIAVSSVRLLGGAPSLGPAGPARAAAALPPMLPEIGDIAALLMQLKAKNRAQAEHNAAAGVAVQDVVRGEASARAREALAQAKEHHEKSGFWGKLGSTLSTVAVVAGVVAAAASVVCTGGASTPAILALAGTLLSASSPLVADVAGEDAGRVAMWGGVALSLGGAGWSACSKTAVAEGAQLAGSSTRTVAAGTQVAAKTTEGGARIAEGYSKVREKREDAKVERSQADAMEARAAVRRSQDQVESLVECLRDLDASVTRAMQTIAQMSNDHHGARQALVTNLRRV